MKLILAFIATLCLFAEDTEKVISAHKFETAIDETGSSTSVINADEIALSGKKQVSELLKTIPSIDVVQSGAGGGNVAVFIRGANSEHTLILLDGIELNNPVSNSRFYNLNAIDPSSIERIEVLRGAQSGVYGSDAIGGVISIITKKGKGTPKTSVSYETGSYHTNNANAEIRGATDLVDYYFNTAVQDTGGISGADASFGNTEKDRFENQNYTARLGFNPDKRVDFALIAKGITNNSEIDNFGGSFGDNPNRNLKTYQQFYRAEANTHFFNNKLSQKFSYSYNNQKLTDGYNLSPETLASEYSGILNKVDFSNLIEISKTVSLIAGFETRRDQADYSYFSVSPAFSFSDILEEVTATNNAGYSEVIIKPYDNFSLSLAGRHDDYSRFDSNNSYRISPKLQLGKSALFANVGTGYKAPSLYQVYSQYGNSGLISEESKSYDIGIEQEVLGAKASFTVFKNDIENLINFDPLTFKFANINEAKTSGAELSLLKEFDNFSFKTSYSYLDTEDESTGESLLRRARNRLTPSIGYKSSDDKFTLGMEAPIVSARSDQAFIGSSVSRVKLPGYYLVNLVGSYKLTDKLDLNSRLNNLFDKEYEDVYGYGTLGMQALFGLRYSL